jgi:hypothetical protein
MTTSGPDHNVAPQGFTARIGGLPIWLKVGAPVLIFGCMACLCCLAAAFVFRERLVELIEPVDPGDFRIDRPADDGSISGVYRYTNLLGAHRARFTVSADGGTATFFVDGALESETLMVTMNGDESVTLSWQGINWDGDGPLTTAERDALESLLASDLALGLKVIPLKAGCRSDDAPSPEQVATLLVPLQMQIKYTVADRLSQLGNLEYYTECREKVRGEWQDLPTIIQLGSSSPVPVVLGHFPFDEEGAVEEGESRVPGAKTACAELVPSRMIGPLVPPGEASGMPAGDEDIRWNETGPCDAKCRGACGADCHPTNCEESILVMCQKDAEGAYTGKEIRVISYTCGLHEGCIEHDLCYDTCNRLLGCKTWAAAVCRHAHPQITPLDPSVFALCDQAAIDKYGIDNTKQWVQGMGIHTSERIFDYPDPDFSPRENHDRCPPGLNEDAEKEPDESPEKMEGEKEPAEPPGESESESPPLQEEESETEQTEVEEDKPQPDPASIDPCDLLPYGGTIGSQHSETGCFKSYATEASSRTAQITVFTGNLDSDSLCDKFTEPSDYHTIVATENYGDCAWRVEYGYKGEPAPGYDGWGVHFYLDRYYVSISTRTDDYHAHDAWIYMAANEVEDNIRTHLGLDER